MLIPDRTDCPAGACRSTTASPSTPLQHPTLRGSALRGINEGSSNSPVRSSPRLRPPGWNGPPLGLSPELRTPPTRSRTTHVEVGTGHRARTWNYTLNSHQSISNPVVHSSCATSRRTSGSGSLRARFTPAFAAASRPPVSSQTGGGSVGQLAVECCALCPAGSVPVTAALAVAGWLGRSVRRDRRSCQAAAAMRRWRAVCLSGS